eukprot:superscaffoldBa00001803_g12087
MEYLVDLLSGWAGGSTTRSSTTSSREATWHATSTLIEPDDPTIRTRLHAAYPPLSAPMANMFGNVPGYEGTVAGGGGYLPPPMPIEPVAPPAPSPTPDDWSIPSLSEDDAREAFTSFAASHCCYSHGPAEDGVITKMEPYNTYRVILLTVDVVITDGSSSEPADFYTETAPRPWEIQATPPSLFTNHTEEIRVPYTSSIKKPCWVCNGTGTRSDENCTRCDSTGNERTNHLEDHVVQQNSGLSADDLHSVSGKELFKNNQYLLFPLLGFPNPAISEASDRLIKEHQSKYAQTSRILQQRQTVELIPITKVTYKWKGDSHIYFVYGNERQVNADNYPATCCCVVM